MKTKRLSLMIAFLIAWMSASAENVTEQQALKIAQQFLQGKTFSLAKSRLLTRGESPRADADLYVFNAEEGGYVVVAGDDHCQPVLGYSDRSRLDMDNLPDNLKAWLDGYAEQIAYLKEHPEAAATRTLSDAQPVLPLLGETAWGQYHPYYSLCPSLFGGHSATGCVATAMAQIMYYHKWPKQTTKEIPSYTSLNFGDYQLVVPAIDAGTPIDWDNMLPVYKYDNFSELQGKAVAQLMQLCGAAVKMKYQGGQSSASTQRVPYALRNYFDYDGAVINLSRDNYRQTEWDNIIYNELHEKRPVLYSGAPVNGGSGHAFVVDGYDKDGFFHINWGWDGGCDGFFMLSALNPKQTVEEEPDDFNFSQIAIIGIQKNAGGTAPSSLYTHWFRTSKTTVYTRNSVGEDFTDVSFSGRFYNMGEDGVFDGAIGVYDMDGILKETVSCFTNEEIQAGVGFQLFDKYKISGSLPDGNYRLMLVAKSPETEKWMPCERAGICYVIAVIAENTLTLYQPGDLINNLSGTIKSKGNAEVEKPLTFDVEITNNGPLFMGVISLFVDNEEVAGQNIDIDQGQTKTVQFVYTPKEKGTSEINVSLLWIDSYNVKTYIPFITESILIGETVIPETEPYVVYDDGMLTFYYDNQRSDRQGTTYGLYDVVGDNCPSWNRHFDTTTKVVFDASFSEAKPKTTYRWFSNFWKIKEIQGLEYLNTSEVTNMGHMFYYVSSLANLDVSGFDTRNVTNMNSMFFLCKGVTDLDVSGFDTGNVTDMVNMFSNCTELTNLIMGSQFTSDESTSIDALFANCSKLCKVTFTGDIPVTINSMFFKGVCTAVVPATLDVPEQYRANYQAKFDGNMFYGGFFILAGVEYQKGDLNGDGEVNGVDLEKMVRLIMNGKYEINADLNSDGVVNAADIVELISIIKINSNVGSGYFWIGTMKPNSSNITTKEGVVTTYRSLSEALSHSPSLAVQAGSYAVVLCPSSWNVNADNVVLQDEESGSNYNLKKDTTDIEGHDVFVTTSKIGATTTVVLKTKADANAN